MRIFKKKPTVPVDVARFFLEHCHLHYIKDIHSKTATGVTMRLPESIYKERREIKMFIALQIVILNIRVGRRPHVASNKR